MATITTSSSIMAAGYCRVCSCFILIQDRVWHCLSNNLDTDSVTDNSDPDTGNIDPNTDNIKPDNIDPDTDNIDPNTDNIKPDNIDPDTDNIDPDTDNIDTVTDNIDPILIIFTLLRIVLTFFPPSHFFIFLFTLKNVLIV